MIERMNNTYIHTYIHNSISLLQFKDTNRWTPINFVSSLAVCAFLKVTLLPGGFYDFIGLLGSSVEIHVKTKRLMGSERHGSEQSCCHCRGG